MGSSAFFILFSIIMYIAIVIGFFALTYIILKTAIKNGLVEAYKEIQKSKLP